MNKKIITLFFLLLVLGSILVVYSYLNQAADENTYTGSNNDISDEDILKELDELFVSEDDDIEIGDIL
jgi:CHASE3 domain sensor protein